MTRNTNLVEETVKLTYDGRDLLREIPGVHGDEAQKCAKSYVCRCVSGRGMCLRVENVSTQYCRGPEPVSQKRRIMKDVVVDDRMRCIVRQIWHVVT
jgi:hypothetical protein